MRLSICIPTYNRGPFIGALLESILDQAGYGCELEVVISDNASSDQTQAVVERYRERFGMYVYHRAESNQGADRNFLKVVELASGDYCWLMGSDDLLEPGAVAAIERMITANPGIAGLSVRSLSYDFEMANRIVQPEGIGYFPVDTRFEGAENVFARLGEYFGFISSNVIGRKLWQSIVESEDLRPYFNAWVHVYVIGRMLQSRQNWGYVAHPCVGWRSGNDSFLAEGEYRRLEIDVAGYHQLTAGLFGEKSGVYRHTMSRILGHALFRIAHAKVHGAPPSFFRQAKRLLLKHYLSFPRFWIEGYPLLYVPAPAVRLGRWAYRKTFKAVRLAKINRAAAAPKMD